MYREPAHGGAPLIIVAFNGKVFGLERTKGFPRWRVDLSSSGGAVELLIDDELVIAVDRGAIAFINYADGTVRKLIKRRDVATAGRAVILTDGPHLIIGGTGEIACYTREGEHVWDQGFTGEGYGPVSIGVPGHVRQADDDRR